MLLAVALLAAVIVAAALLEHRDLVALGLGDDLGTDGQALDRLQLRPFAGQQHVGDVDPLTGFTGHLLDDDLVSQGNAILLAARAHDCEHWLYSSLQNLASTRLSAPRHQRSRGKRAAYGRGPELST